MLVLRMALVLLDGVPRTKTPVCEVACHPLFLQTTFLQTTFLQTTFLRTTQKDATALLLLPRPLLVSLQQAQEPPTVARQPSTVARQPQPPTVARQLPRV
jgi:hypothetical protein